MLENNSTDVIKKIMFSVPIHRCAACNAVRRPLAVAGVSSRKQARANGVVPCSYLTPLCILLVFALPVARGASNDCIEPSRDDICPNRSSSSLCRCRLYVCSQFWGSLVILHERTRVGVAPEGNDRSTPVLMVDGSERHQFDSKV